MSRRPFHIVRLRVPCLKALLAALIFLAGFTSFAGAGKAAGRTDELSFPFSQARIVGPSCGNPARIMPLGDSITIGYSVEITDAEDMIGYRRELWQTMMADGYCFDLVGSLTGGETYNDFDLDHEGHGGYSANQLVPHIYGSSGENWLGRYPADIILLHIGTNDLSNWQDPAAIRDEVEEILDKIDQYEADSGEEVLVILAQIINRRCISNGTPCTQGVNTTEYNNLLRAMAEDRQARGDRIMVVDMENGAGIDYRSFDVGGDMQDNIHPAPSGYSKMAEVWLDVLEGILPPGRPATRVVYLPAVIRMHAR